METPTANLAKTEQFIIIKQIKFLFGQSSIKTAHIQLRILCFLEPELINPWQNQCKWLCCNADNIYRQRLRSLG
jgi:hypothetical protein